MQRHFFIASATKLCKELPRNHHHLLHNANNMKFSTSAFAFLSVACSASSATAFTPVGNVARHRFAAAALFSTSTEIVGETNTESFRMKFKGDSGVISPWHDIPLKEGDMYNMVVEIPKMTKAKMEVATKEENNPIAQDIKKGKLRDCKNVLFCLLVSIFLFHFIFIAILTGPDYPSFVNHLCRPWTHLLELWMPAPDLGGSQR